MAGTRLLEISGLPAELQKKKTHPQQPRHPALSCKDPERRILAEHLGGFLRGVGRVEPPSKVECSVLSAQ